MRKTLVRWSFTAIFVLVATTAAATSSSRVFTPSAGQTVTVDTMRLDVIDVQATRWTPPPGASVAHFATVRATDGSTARTITLTDTPNRVAVVKDHAIRLHDQPLTISVAPAPPLAIDSIAAERIALATATVMSWSVTSPSSVLLTFRTTWEIAFQLAQDMDGVVDIDATTGRVLSASKRGGF
jgi:hypothetical protein